MSNSEGDLWRTPPEVFSALNKEFNFGADMACSNENKLCQIGYTEQDNSLNLYWHYEIEEIIQVDGLKYVWCNPPYSNPLPWVGKAIESQKHGLGVVMLLNADDSPQWFYEALKGVSEIRRITGYKQGGKWKNGRLEFINHKGEPVKGNNKAQFILVFNPFKIGAQVTSHIAKNKLMELGR